MPKGLEVTRREEIKKWNWKVDWCKANKLSYSNTEAWEKAEHAFEDEHPIRSRPARAGRKGIAIIGAIASMGIR